jgi:deoxyguanosine kinase
MYLAIEGVIGVGKTTLARLLQRVFSAEVLLEAFEENPFLSDFYSDRERYAFQTQIFFLLSRYHQQRQTVPEVLARGNLIADYTFEKDALFAELNLRGDELDTYSRLHEALAERIVRPDLTVFLRVETDVVMGRIAMRDRAYERSMDRAITRSTRPMVVFRPAALSPVLAIDTSPIDIVHRPEPCRDRPAHSQGPRDRALSARAAVRRRPVRLIITRAKLVELARREAEARAASGDLISAYLVGSVAYGEPLLGGTADIDLVLIHNDDTATEREMLPLSADVHLDIVHHGRQRYAQPRGLRIDPWIGPAISGPVFLYDPQHFFEWAQAGARGQFFRADHALVRARALLQAARARLPHPLPNQLEPGTLLEAAIDGANAAASLAGAPAAGRRMLLDLERRGQALARPEVSEGLIRLFGIERGDSRAIPAWIAAWARASVRPRPSPAIRGCSCRRAYHLAGSGVAKPDVRCNRLALLIVWERTLRVPEAYRLAADHRAAWEDALHDLGLPPEARQTRALELESYLDAVEMLIDGWAARNGG